MKSMAARPQKPEFAEGVALVKGGSTLVAAATAVGVTEAALRTACKAAGVYIITDKRQHARRLSALATRNREAIAAYLRNVPLDDICRDIGVTPTFMRKLLHKELGVTLELPRQSYRRRNRAPTLQQVKARLLASELLARRANGEKITLAQFARSNGLHREGLRTAVRTLKRERQNTVDDGPPVGDTSWIEGD